MKTNRRRGAKSAPPAAAPLFPSRRRRLAATAIVLACGASFLLQHLFLSTEQPQPPAEGPPQARGELAVLPALRPDKITATSVTSAGLAREGREMAVRLVECYPQSCRAQSLGGRIYYAFGDEAAAARCWEACLEIDPRFAPAWQAMGEAAWERGDYPTAVRRLQTAIEVDPALERQASFLLADSLANTGNAEEAVRVLQRWSQAGPLPSEGRLLLAQVLLQSGENERAREEFEQLLASNSASVKAQFGLAATYARLGKPDLARKHREEYLKLKTRSVAEAIRRRAAAQPTDVADLRQVAAQSYLNAGKIHALHWDGAAAERHWRRAGVLAPGDPEPRRLLSMLHAEQSRSPRFSVPADTLKRELQHAREDRTP